MFVRIMLFSWLGMLLPWFSFGYEEEGFCWGIWFFPYLMVQMAVLIVLCNNEPESKSGKVFCPIMTEVCLASFPVVYFWAMMMWYYPIVTSEDYLATGLSTAYPPFWVAFALTFVPILAFPILRRWKKDEVK